MAYLPKELTYQELEDGIGVDNAAEVQLWFRQNPKETVFKINNRLQIRIVKDYKGNKYTMHRK